MITEVKSEHPKNALQPNFVILSGIIIDDRLVQSEKAPAPISMTPSDMVTEVKLVQPLKAPSPIDLTLLGI